MVRAKQTAAEYMERHDAEMRIILGELVESAGLINLAWTSARYGAQADVDGASTVLVEALIRLEIHVRNERLDSLRVIRTALKLLDGEVPDDEEDETTDQ